MSIEDNYYPLESNQPLDLYFIYNTDPTLIFDGTPYTLSADLFELSSNYLNAHLSFYPILPLKINIQDFYNSQKNKSIWQQKTTISGDYEYLELKNDNMVYLYN